MRKIKIWQINYTVQQTIASIVFKLMFLSETRQIEYIFHKTNHLQTIQMIKELAATDYHPIHQIYFTKWKLPRLLIIIKSSFSDSKWKYNKKQIINLGLIDYWGQGRFHMKMRIKHLHIIKWIYTMKLLC